MVVPAFQERRLIGKTLSTIPPWVEHIIVVDDGSQDGTGEAVRRLHDSRVSLVEKAHNQGVGRAIMDGYEIALRKGAEVLVVMAGDNQMDPADLERVVRPIREGQADYVKGNRFEHPEKTRMPLPRRIAGIILGRLTSIAAGVSVEDSQCGYTALAAPAASLLLQSNIWPRYGYPNDILVVLGRQRQRIFEVPVRPVYRDEASGVRWWHALAIIGVIARRWASQSFFLTGQRHRRDFRAPLDPPHRTEHPPIEPLGPR